MSSFCVRIPDLSEDKIPDLREDAQICNENYDLYWLNSDSWERQRDGCAVVCWTTTSELYDRRNHQVVHARISDGARDRRKKRVI